MGLSYSNSEVFLALIQRKMVSLHGCDKGSRRGYERHHGLAIKAEQELQSKLSVWLANSVVLLWSRASEGNRFANILDGVLNESLYGFSNWHSSPLFSLISPGLNTSGRGTS